jgi:hypothetical protein
MSTEHRLSLISFHESTVNIKTWWLTEDKYALLEAAMGDPEVDSIYSRDYINDTADEVLGNGVHDVKDSD